MNKYPLFCSHLCNDKLTDDVCTQMRIKDWVYARMSIENGKGFTKSMDDILILMARMKRLNHE